MSSTEVSAFARDFFASSENYLGSNPEVFTVHLGDQSVEVRVEADDSLSKYIRQALLLVESGHSKFTLNIWRTTKRSPLPNLDWARNYLVHDNLVPPSITQPFKIAFDKSQGFIYLYDTELKRAAIWIAEDSKISLNSFVTPFRIIFSWMAEAFGGEIVHASAISRNGRGLIINGPSGSGKSTLALLCALNGFEIVADDVVLAYDGKISAIYRYAKVDPNSSPLNLSHLTTFQMQATPGAKNILDLTQFGGGFVRQTNAKAIILPIFAHLNAHGQISPSIAIKLLAPNSLRELMGGTPYNFKNLVNLTRELPNFRIALSADNSKNLNSIDSIFLELS